MNHIKITTAHKGMTTSEQIIYGSITSEEYFEISENYSKSHVIDFTEENLVSHIQDSGMNVELYNRVL